MLKKMAIFFGLGPDEHYENYDNSGRPHRTEANQSRFPTGVQQRPTPMSVGDPSDPFGGRTVRPVPINPTPTPQVSPARLVGPVGSSGVFPVPPGGSGTSAGQHRDFRTDSSDDPINFSPVSFFDDLQAIADAYLGGRSVIVNLEGMDVSDRRRLTDFAVGVCYAQGGKLKQVADKVIVLCLQGASEQAVRAATPI